jgi:molybdopterin-guanine dinucleotide biosynthesis protein A
MSDFSALVLAAGRSTRMGRDKALLEVDGVPLWQRQRDVLLMAGAKEIFLSARPDQAWARSVSGFTAVLHDALPGCGPLVGITAGIERASHPVLAVLAVDLAAMSYAWFKGLLAQASPACGMVGRRGDFYEPLAAVYPREIKWLAWEALAKGEYALQPLIARAVNDGLLHERAIATGDEARFVNWNRP